MAYVHGSVTTSKAARLLGKAPHTVKALMRDGHLLYVQVGDKKVIHLTEIDRFQRYGNYDPSTYEEQTNAQSNSNQKAQRQAQIKSEVFERPTHSSPTLPKEEYDGQSFKGSGQYALERARITRPEDSSVRAQADGVSGTGTPGEPNQSGRAAVPSEGSRDQERVPMDEVEKVDPSNVDKTEERIKPDGIDFWENMP